MTKKKGTEYCGERSDVRSETRRKKQVAELKTMFSLGRKRMN